MSSVPHSLLDKSGPLESHLRVRIACVNESYFNNEAITTLYHYIYVELLSILLHSRRTLTKCNFAYETLVQGELGVQILS